MFETQIPLRISPKPAHIYIGAENGQVEQENQCAYKCVYNGHAGCFHRSHPAGQNIVQHIYKIGDAVLNHDRDGCQERCFYRIVDRQNTVCTLTFRLLVLRRRTWISIA